MRLDVQNISYAKNVHQLINVKPSLKETTENKIKNKNAFQPFISLHDISIHFHSASNHIGHFCTIQENETNQIWIIENLSEKKTKNKKQNECILIVYCESQPLNVFVALSAQSNEWGRKINANELYKLDNYRLDKQKHKQKKTKKTKEYSY